MDDQVAVVACGALTSHIQGVARRRGWPVRVYSLPPLLHDRPRRIAGAVEELGLRVASRHRGVVVGYAGCGTRGELDAVCARHGWPMLRGAHCYDVFAGPEQVAALVTQEPGTYLLTDYLVRSFHRSVVVELGLDRYPELRADYFGHYRRVVWLAQLADPRLRAAARAAAAYLHLPLLEIRVGEGGLEAGLEGMLMLTTTS
ncbi:MAG: DUF1638 domain-containing protein [Actinomycetes bacterium]